MAHYYDEKPQVEFKSNTVETRINGIDFRFETGSGVFSKRQLDFGTKLLIETVIVKEGKPAGRLLDLGCGYGPVGIAFKRISPALSVVMCDVNSRALELAKNNAAANNVQYVDVRLSNGLSEITGQFDLILTNPPIRAGKSTVYRFFEESFDALKNGGRLYCVIQKKQGAPSAFNKLQELFNNCDIIARSAGYWILSSVRV
jgi:16S rRNA (guanine1207-N2)-methyltransferase